jgi:protein-tyrosine phosphatase
VEKSSGNQSTNNARRKRRELIPFEPKRKVVRYLRSWKSTPKNFRWIEDKKLASSAAPVRQKQLDWLLKNNGVKSVLSLTEDDLTSKGFDTSKIRFYKHVPMIDHAIPSQDQISNAVSFVESKMNDSESTPVLIHCLGGMGRTGVVAACFLAKKNGWTADEALAMLRAIWPEYVEGKQESAVREFIREQRKN